MVDILVEATGQDRERIVADLDRDYIIRGEQALEYGAVDHILERRNLAVVGALHPTEATAS
jgi:ATP-dependent protease ClpP protease subunit